jgi:hypothetical protein
MPTNWVDQVLGHKLINSRDAYSLPTDEELRDSYIQAYPYVSVCDEIPKPDSNSHRTIAESSIIDNPDMVNALRVLARFAKALKE